MVLVSNILFNGFFWNVLQIFSLDILASKVSKNTSTAVNECEMIY